jgi:membrane protease YdiL (CAAX protease family)
MSDVSVHALSRPEPARPAWSVLRVLAYSTLIGICYVVTQSAAGIAVLVSDVVADPNIDLNAWAARAESDGFIVAVSTLAAVVTCIPLVRWLVGRREQDPWSYLGFRACSGRALLAACASICIFIAASDGLTLALGRPLVPEFMTLAYASARSHALFLAALLIGAPLVEELLFRGFLLSALRALGAPAVAGAVLTSLGWAAIHVQYDAYGMGVIFAMGLLYAAVRIRFDSIVPTIAMHSLTNAVAYAEVMVLAPPGAR